MLACLGICMGALAPAGAAARQAHLHRAGLAAIPGTTAKPRWACPEGACDAIILPRPIHVRGGYGQRGSTSPYQANGELGGLDPAELQAAYNVPTTLSSPQTIAVIDDGGYPDAESDLATYREKYGLPPCTKASGCFKKVNQQGKEGEYPAEEPGWDEEAATDADMASAGCPQCHILLVETNESEALSPQEIVNFGKAVDTAVSLGATEISNSWGIWEADEESCGSKHCTQYDEDYEHPGVLITAAAGDEGYDSVYADLGYGSTVFPASLADVVAAGGTELLKNASAPRGWSEKVWNSPPDEGFPLTEGAGTGSGCTQFQPKPPWQSDSGCSHRTDDDVAAVGAGETPVSVRWDGNWILLAGTSVSAPLVAGIEAHASAYVRTLGPEAFYEDPSALFDITEGYDWNWDGIGRRPTSECAPNEYLCNAEAGYDGPTGIGAPDGVPVISAPPSVETRPASGVAQTTATLNATVNPNGGEVSACKLEYGSSLPSGQNVACSPPPGSGTNPVTVTGAVSGLTANTTYLFRVVATNAGGTSTATAQSFTTQGAAEFGRCVKVTKGRGAYKTSACDSTDAAGSYEWTPGVLKAGFRTTLGSGSVTLETAAVAHAKATKVTCKAETGAGEYTGRQTVGGVVLTLTGCELTSPLAKCASSLAQPGEIVTSSLEGSLGVEKLGTTSAADKLALDVYPVGRTGPLMTFSCASTTRIRAGLGDRASEGEQDGAGGRVEIQGYEG